jgi:formate C-acetyltransferase
MAVKPATSVPPRIRRLLDRWQPTGQERTWYPNGGDERAILLWQYFQRSASEPIALRRAHGLAYVLAEIAIAIHDDELIVGEVGLEDVARTRPQQLAAAKGYWKARERGFVRSLPTYAAEQEATTHALSWKWHSRDGHAIPAFDAILAEGLDGLRDAATKASAAYPPLACDAIARQEQWQSMIIALDAFTAYIHRYAQLAQAMAAAAPPDRRAELLPIAAACAWIATQPPRTFGEALQLTWFVHLGIKMDDGGVGHSFGRFDQYLYPFYQADIAANRLTVEQARELLALFWIKLNREADDIAHLSLGGQTPEGADATNDLSFLCLEVERWVGRKQPNLSTRVHASTPNTYWDAIAQTIRQGAGHPAVFNDEVIIPGLLDYGLPASIVRDYAEVGCVETFLPGLGAPWTDCYLNLAKCLELALNDGCCLLTGNRIGPATGNAHAFATFDDLFAAYERQVEQALYAMLAAKDGFDTVVSRHAPEPLNSAFIHDCLARGMDATGGGARYLLTGAYGVGLGTTIDSLAALKTLVYDEQLVSMADLLAALRGDFAGDERTLTLCRQRAPKYGNDDARADAIAVRVIESFGRQARHYPASNPQAFHYAMLGSVLSHTAMGERTAASANGRHSGETLSDGGSPSQGENRHGATATLRSLAKADYRLAPGGAAINLRLAPRDLAGKEGIHTLASLLKTYIALGGEQLQVTVADGEMLRQALEHPDQHRDLVVRVAGFTAYFVTLTPAIQQEILARADAAL